MGGTGRWSLAIDFGATTTTAAICDESGAVTPLRMPNGLFTVPSSVLFDGVRLLVGEDAERAADRMPDGYEPKPRLRIGERRITLGGNDFSPDEVVAAVFAAVLSVAIAQQGDKRLTDVALTHPLRWPDSWRRVLHDAFGRAARQLADAPNVTLLPEPVAAGHWIAVSARLRDGEIFAICDTDDDDLAVTVLKVTGDDLVVVADGALDTMPDHVGSIYPIGSAARAPALEEALAPLHVPVRASDDPALVVCRGAALIAGHSAPGPLSGDTRVEAALPFHDDVHFTVYRPKSVQPLRWAPLLAFAHLGEAPEGADPSDDPIRRVQQHAQVALGPRFAAYMPLSQGSAAGLPEDAEVTFELDLPRFDVERPVRTFLWINAFHMEEFQIRASAALEGTTARGRLLVFHGSLLLGEVHLSTRVDSQAPQQHALEQAPVVAAAYRKIFPSYSHADSQIVDEYELYAETLGDRYLRDVRALRSGEQWDERLSELIDDADVFQLFWSRNAMASRFVEREWRYALSLERANFIRPFYWEEPMPTAPGLPPETLGSLHFHALGRAAGRGIEAASPPPVERQDAKRGSWLRRRAGVAVITPLIGAGIFAAFVSTMSLGGQTMVADPPTPDIPTVMLPPETVTAGPGPLPVGPIVPTYDPINPWLEPDSAEVGKCLHLAMNPDGTFDWRLAAPAQCDSPDATHRVVQVTDNVADCVGPWMRIPRQPGVLCLVAL